MSSYTVLTVERPAGEQVSLARIEALARVLCDYEPEYIDQTTPQDGRIVWETKWTPDGVAEIARRLARSYPDASVEWVEEWNTLDADEPGSAGQRYRGGVLVETGATQMIWTAA